MTDLLQHADHLQRLYDAQTAQVAQLTTDLAAADAEVLLLTHVHAVLDTLLQTLSRESTGQIEALVTRGLQAAFPDLTLVFTLPLEIKRGTPWLEPTLTEGGATAPVLEAFGGGPATVVAFLLRLLTCRRLGLAPVLLLDEPFGFVSHAYVETVAKLLRELAERLGLTIILVTHHPGFLSEATRAYEAQVTPTGTVFVPAG